MVVDNSPILITGCPRSGATMIASAIQICGAFGGNYTKRSMCSNDSIQQICKNYLNFLGADENGLYPLPNFWASVGDWKQKVEQSILKDGYSNGLWFYKDYKNTLLFPIWKINFPQAKWVIVRRKKEEIVNSCLHTKYLNIFKNTQVLDSIGVTDEAQAFGWLVDQYLYRIEKLKQSGVLYKEIWPERMVKGDYSQLFEILNWLNLEWCPEIVERIDPMLQNSRNKIKKS